MLSKNIKNQAILLVTDKESKVIIDQYKALKDATSEYADVFIAYHQKETSIPSCIFETNYYIFNNSVLTDLGFKPIGDKLLPGNNHFPLLEFYRNNPAYEYYWVIEDDVRFSGNWAFFFNSFFKIQSDFITCCIRQWTEEPDWCLWKLELKITVHTAPLNTEQSAPPNTD